MPADDETHFFQVIPAGSRAKIISNRSPPLSWPWQIGWMTSSINSNPFQIVQEVILGASLVSLFACAIGGRILGHSLPSPATGWFHSRFLMPSEAPGVDYTDPPTTTGISSVLNSSPYLNCIHSRMALRLKWHRFFFFPALLILKSLEKVRSVHILVTSELPFPKRPNPFRPSFGALAP